MAVILTRTIHHGSYRDVQQVSAPTFIEAVRALRPSTYDTRSHQAIKVAVIVANADPNPTTHGTTEHGWVTYNVSVVVDK